MADSAGHKLWHSLKVNDILVFTLVSSSHFVVEFAKPNGSTRAMFPTKDVKDYPWYINYYRLDCLASASRKVQLQAVKAEQIRKMALDVKEKQIRKNVQVVKEREIRQLGSFGYLTEQGEAPERDIVPVQGREWKGHRDKLKERVCVPRVHI